MMKIISSERIPDVKVVVPDTHNDDRGSFLEVWREDLFSAMGVDCRFVQENVAFSRSIGTVRGLHFQIGSSAQAKLVRCSQGEILDVAVDLRKGSPTFGQHVAEFLSSENRRQLFIPIGFAHGYCTLVEETEVIYKASAYYDPTSECGIRWNDPDIGIVWPVDESKVIISDKDRNSPSFKITSASRKFDR